jgi:hypothetical protein
MAGALSVYDRVTDPLAFAKEFALPAASLIGCDINQGAAMALQALSEGIPLMQLRRRYHWIQGAPSMRADAMRAEFRMNHGGNFTIVEASPDKASIEFVDRDGKTILSTVTWEEAKGEPWPWKGGCGPGTAKNDPANPAHVKDNWATPLSRANMLIARATSRGLRLLCPELVAGIYTPEEMGDVGDAVGNAAAAVVATTTPARPTASQILAAQAAGNGNGNGNGNGHAATAPAAAAPVVDANVIDAEFTPAAAGAPSEPPFDATSTETAPAAAPAKGTIRSIDIGTINGLLAELFPEDVRESQLANILAKRQVAALDQLTHEQAKEIIKRLRYVKASRKATAGVGSPN